MAAGERRIIRRLSFCAVLTCILSPLVPSISPAQSHDRPSAEEPRIAPRPSLLRVYVQAGYDLPLSEKGIKKFWPGGTAASASLLINRSPEIGFGLGMDAALLKFRASSFRSTFPGVLVQARDVAYLSLFIALRYTPFAKKRLAPFFGANVGIAKFTQATYIALVDSVRKTYYNVPGIARLTLGVVGGTDYYITRWFALTAEAKLTYMLHDPNAELGVLVVGGFRFTL